jgi:hypothetical protein
MKKPKHKNKPTPLKLLCVSPKETKALSLEKKRRLHLMPQESNREMLTVRGADVIESLLLARNPAALSKDLLLLRAKHAAKQAKADHLPISELRGVSWFAYVPEFSGDITKALFDEGNFYASSFWAVWKREPETVLKLVAKIRNQLKTEKHKDVEDVITQPNLYSASGHAARKKAVQRARERLKPPPHVAEFAARLRQQPSIRRTK